jgi:phage gp36-like protein
MAAYITHDEFFRLAYPQHAFDSLGANPEDLDTAIEAASSEASCHLVALHDTPLTLVPDAIKLHVARAALYHLLSFRGFSATGADEMVERNYARALSFYRQVQKSQVTLPDNETEPDKQPAHVVVSSRPQRGW